MGWALIVAIIHGGEKRASCRGRKHLSPFPPWDRVTVARQGYGDPIASHSDDPAFVNVRFWDALAGAHGRGSEAYDDDEALVAGCSWGT
jgi:hypothetical protein